VVATEGRIEEQISMGNPAPVYDAIRNRLWCVFTRENQRVFATFSDDAARTWQRPREITSAVRPPQWTRYWTGPGHGLQLRHRSRHGRLVVPSYHLELESPDGGATSVIVMRSHMLLSDDHGDTWRIGGSTRLAPELAGATARRLAGKWIPGEAAWEGGECMVEELEDGRLYLIVRDQARHDGRKAFAWSHDGGETWTPLALQPQLPDPGCQSSLLRYRPQGAEARDLFVSTGITRDDRVAVAAGGDGATSTPVAAPGKGRQRLAVFVSDDDCRSWREAGVIHAGPAAYSDLVPMRDGSLLCLYESGEDGAYETIRLHRLETRSLRR
jgi:sialidase-1